MSQKEKKSSQRFVFSFSPSEHSTVDFLPILIDREREFAQNSPSKLLWFFLLFGSLALLYSCMMMMMIYFNIRRILYTITSCYSSQPMLEKQTREKILIWRRCGGSFSFFFLANDRFKIIAIAVHSFSAKALGKIGNLKKVYSNECWRHEYWKIFASTVCIHTAIVYIEMYVFMWVEGLKCVAFVEKIFYAVCSQVLSDYERFRLEKLENVFRLFCSFPCAVTSLLF